MLQRYGVQAVLYEANTRLGGRVYSDRTTFPSQVAEVGGELIDNLHKTMIAYARELGLLREDLGKAPGESTFYVGGQHYREDQVIDEWRQMEDAMRPDLQSISGAPSFYAHTAADVALDQIDLGTYLATRGANQPIARTVLEQAYIAEYGREASEQSCLNFLLFIHLDRRRKLAEYGVFSDERYHVIGGNDQIVEGIRQRLTSPIVTGAELEGLSRNAFGEYALKMRGASTPERADAVVLAVPFSTLRRVTLDPSLGLSADKRRAIDELGYGYNAKTMVGFQGRPWIDRYGADGLIYADLPNLQTTWETNYTRAGATSILTDYAGGARGRALQYPPPPLGQSSSCNACHTPPSFALSDDTTLQAQADAFLTDLDRVWPGARGAASRVGGKYVVRRGHWLAQKYSRGSYTCYTPGQFTSIAGLEGEAAGFLKFAGEHANSFYEWQGFMEGACLSGIAAAGQILEDMKQGRL